MINPVAAAMCAPRSLRAPAYSGMPKARSARRAGPRPSQAARPAVLAVRAASGSQSEAATVPVTFTLNHKASFKRARRFEYSWVVGSSYTRARSLALVCAIFGRCWVRCTAKAARQPGRAAAPGAMHMPCSLPADATACPSPHCLPSPAFLSLPVLHL